MTILVFLFSLLPLVEQYNAGNYEAVVARADSVLAETNITRADSLRIRKLHAFSLIALGRSRQAESIFLALLEQYPNLELDPSEVSPKIRAVFDEVKRNAAARQSPVPIRVDTLRLRQPVPLSVLVPGISQLQGHKSVKGYALLGAMAVSLAGFGVSHLSYNQAHRDYLAATQPQQIVDEYQAANAWYRTRIVFSGGAAAVWLLSLLDGLSSQ